MYNPQAISFDIQRCDPFAVSIPGKSWDPVGNYELLQWTGLTDAHGLDVYEADLVLISSEVYRVYWNESQAAFELQAIGNSLFKDVNVIPSSKVIGNIYQNGPI